MVATLAITVVVVVAAPATIAGAVVRGTIAVACIITRWGGRSRTRRCRGVVGCISRVTGIGGVAATAGSTATAASVSLILGVARGKELDAWIVSTTASRAAPKIAAGWWEVAFVRGAVAAICSRRVWIAVEFTRLGWGRGRGRGQRWCPLGWSLGWGLVVTILALGWGWPSVLRGWRGLWLIIIVLARASLWRWHVAASKARSVTAEAVDVHETILEADIW